MTEQLSEKAHYCYILRNSYPKDINKTYNGYTVLPKRRIRQHNQEITGGAKYTKRFGNKSWEMYVIIAGFPNSVNALQCEWKIKHPDNKRIRPYKYNTVKGRIVGLNEVLKLSKWTNPSTILNKDMKLTVWILTEYVHLLTNLPNNITVIPCDKRIDLDNLIIDTYDDTINDILILVIINWILILLGI